MRWLVVAALLVGCPDEPTGAFEAGERLEARVWVGDSDEARSFIEWIDSDEDEACSFAPGVDGHWYCLPPTPFRGPTLFEDPLCETRVTPGPEEGLGSEVYWELGGPPEDRRVQFRQLGTPRRLTKFYEASANGGCNEVNYGYEWAQPVFSAEPPSDLIRAAAERATVARGISNDVLVAEDGARFVGRTVIDETGIECRLAPTWAPHAVTYGRCVPVDSTIEQDLYRRGACELPSELIAGLMPHPIVEFEYRGSGRLQAVVAVVSSPTEEGADVLVRPDVGIRTVFWDDQLQMLCEPRPQDGVCVPLPASVAEPEIYADPSCTIRLFSPRCGEAPGLVYVDSQLHRAGAGHQTSEVYRFTSSGCEAMTSTGQFFRVGEVLSEDMLAKANVFRLGRQPD